ncbi:MAG: helix-turn-helix transcriptional regulator [Saccharospirillaceae bacterium]|nr:helix-turn-helix transcriptional regulator [Pseudomonadales bacterium]NRB79793.1 helix-turn-helix transcriptional regulator [Saccharospirillaceae bacterium]
MPNLKIVSPSKESEQPLNNPITVVKRSLNINTTVKKHSHSWGQFVYAHKGVLSVVTADEQYIVPPEQAVWLLPHIEHEVSAISDTELTSFYVDNTLLHQLPAKNTVLEVNDFLKALILEANNIDENYQWKSTDGRLLQLIMDRLAIAPKVILQLPTPKDPRLLKMLTIIQNNPATGYNLKQWGTIVGASTRSLSRLFKSETGLSYRQWRQRLNVQIAISQLSTDQTITSISLNLGYESAAAFTHMFKQNTGKTPSFYRNKI